MDAVFIYEDKVTVDEKGNYYIGSAFSQAVFDRYLEHFDHLTLVMRKSNIAPNDEKSLARLNRICPDRISVVFLPNPMESLSSFLNLSLRRKYKEIICSNITPGRAVIVRAPSKSGTVAAKYCSKNGKPFLVEAVGCPWDSYWNHSVKGKLLAPIAWKNFRFTVRKASFAVYVTSRFLQRRYPARGESASISDVMLQPVSDEIIEKRLLHIHEHNGVIKLATAAAVDVGFKGQQYVIEALAKLKAEGHPEFEYHMAGGGDRTNLQELACRLGVEQQVVFEGSLPHDRMFSWLDEMDVYIQPSLQEGLPRAVIEAMSRGLPAIGARTGGIPELLGEKAIFRRKNPTAIKELLLSLDKEQLAQMATNNFSQAKSFEQEALDEKRYVFYRRFAEFAKENDT